MYLSSKGGEPWNYRFVVHDKGFKRIAAKRRFTHYRGAQWSGQVWPQEVARRILEDDAMFEPQQYPCEEIYFSTYAHAYAVETGIQIDQSIVTINWSHQYLVEDVPPYAYAVCKVSENHPLREMFKKKRRSMVC